MQLSAQFLTNGIFSEIFETTVNTGFYFDVNFYTTVVT